MTIEQIIRPGDRVLAREIEGDVWHICTKADAVFVYTREVPTGFRRSFVVDVKETLRRIDAGVCESCAARPGEAHNDFCG